MPVRGLSNQGEVFNKEAVIACQPQKGSNTEQICGLLIVLDSIYFTRTDCDTSAGYRKSKIFNASFKDKKDLSLDTLMLALNTLSSTPAMLFTWSSIFSEKMFTSST